MRFFSSTQSKVLATSLAAVIIVGWTSFQHYSSTGQTCFSCHEIRPAHEMWSSSSHRDVGCESCHGSALSNGLHSLWQNSRRLVSHFSESRHDDIRLNEPQVVEMVDRCRSCHEREYAGWLSSGHSMTYSAVFLNQEHNQTEQVNDDCLRCHGMFFEGTVRDIVSPISTTGPWKLLRQDLANRPAIPCLACHEIHAHGTPAARPDYSNPKAIAKGRVLSPPKAALYDRREKTHWPAELLPEDKVWDGDRQVDASTDDSQKLCFQCHATNAMRVAGSSDDRTPRGVHEGLSCSTCHESHSMDVRRSCGDCHPSLSNCGLDVQKMDTTFRSADSKHNIHFVACADCHTKGIPTPKEKR